MESLLRERERETLTQQQKAIRESVRCSLGRGFQSLGTAMGKGPLLHPNQIQLRCCAHEERLSSCLKCSGKFIWVRRHPNFHYIYSKILPPWLHVLEFPYVSTWVWFNSKSATFKTTLFTKSWGRAVQFLTCSFPLGRNPDIKTLSTSIFGSISVSAVRTPGLLALEGLTFWCNSSSLSGAVMLQDWQLLIYCARCSSRTASCVTWYVLDLPIKET